MGDFFYLIKVECKGSGRVYVGIKYSMNVGVMASSIVER